MRGGAAIAPFQPAWTIALRSRPRPKTMAVAWTTGVPARCNRLYRHSGCRDHRSSIGYHPSRPRRLDCRRADAMIGPDLPIVAEQEMIDATGLYPMPDQIDSHVHLYHASGLRPEDGQPKSGTLWKLCISRLWLAGAACSLLRTCLCLNFPVLRELTGKTSFSWPFSGKCGLSKWRLTAVLGSKFPGPKNREFKCP